MPKKTVSKKPAATESKPSKDHSIRPGQSKALLQALHILTRDGKLNQDSRRKLKQVYHLYQFIEPLLLQVLAQKDQVCLVDHGAGKSYLGFILYDLFFKARTEADGKSPGNVYGVEVRPELVSHSQALAQEFGSQITNVLRALQLEAHGYRVRVTELVGWEHSLKNELIIAEHTGRPHSDSAVRLQRLLEETGLQSLQARFFTP